MWKFWICVAGIYACFLTWGVLQERVSTTVYTESVASGAGSADAMGDVWSRLLAAVGAGSAAAHSAPRRGKFKYFLVLNWVQAVCACAIAAAYLLCTGQGFGLTTPGEDTGKVKGKGQAQPRRLNRALLWKYLETAVLNSVASPFGYEALKYIDYPTMTLGKSCKLLPVMLMHYILYRRRFPWYKYLSVAIITTGVSTFMLWHPTAKSGSHATSGAVAASSLYGLGLLLVNLLIDGATNSSQDHIFARFRVNGMQMMLFMNLFGAALMAAFLAAQGTELHEAVAFLRVFPQALRDILVFGVCGALGQVFIFYTLQAYGSVSLVTVTVTRKLFTMLLSVFWYDHRLAPAQWASVAVVFGGIALEERYKKLYAAPQKPKVQ